jgi:hypothetical protein
MGKRRPSKWWGLYALVPLMIALMIIDVDGAMSQTWHLILLAGIVLIISALALSWVERNPQLIDLDELGVKDSDPAARQLYTGVEDEWTFVPICHSGTDD